MNLKTQEHETFMNREGETVNRWVLEVNAVPVQVLQYDECPEVIVFIDDEPERMDITQVVEYLERITA